MVHDLLFELGTEELPSGSVWPLAEALAKQIEAGLLRLTITHGAVRCFATPRRLAVLIHDVNDTAADQIVSRRGPQVAVATDKDGNPLPALLGFASSLGVSVNALFIDKTEKGAWWAYQGIRIGASTRQLLPGLLRDVLSALPIAKPMRWGNGEILFARPVHWAVLLFGKEVVPCVLLGISTGQLSMGHRFHCPDALLISTPKAYESLLEEAFVVPDFSKRQRLIVHQLQELAATQQAQIVMPQWLLEEVTALVEWPKAVLVSFDPAFLEVPAEALIAAMQTHQKCFAFRDAEDRLLPCFAAVLNLESRDPLRVVLGNERVMRARLSDAAFFYREDRRQALSWYLPKTAQVVFQAKLGSLHDKMSRVRAVMAQLVMPLQLIKKDALRAAELSKCDLMTGMVREFPELQGVMGSYYARHDGESEGVADALREQYLPRFAADALPVSPLGFALSLADRMDTLVGAFAIGERPTGEKDPFKLRRHALAVVRLLIASKASLGLSTLIAEVLKTYNFVSVAPDLADLKSFILERLPSYYQAEGVSASMINAVRVCQDEVLLDFDNRLSAVQAFVERQEAVGLSAACKRVSNLLKQAGQTIDNAVFDPNHLRLPAEKDLFDEIQQAEQVVIPWYNTGNYSAILERLANLHQAVDAFFTTVMVFVEDADIRANRLCLLSRLQALLQGVVDMSLLT